MNVNEIADARLKQHGRALTPDDELHIVAELIETSVREQLSAMGANSVPTPLSKADMTAIAEVMAKCAYDAVSAQMAEMREKIDIMSDQLAFLTNVICRMEAEKAQAAAEPPRRKLLGLL